jgi:rubrerythrin
MSTSDNLKAAFTGESQANRKYLAFAQKAQDDGLPQIAKLFRAAAEAETIHAHAHLRVMGGVKPTLENLQAAIEGENYEYQKMYPAFLQQALTGGNQSAAMSFRYAMEVEKIHYQHYLRALETLKSGKDLPPSRLFICPLCGNTFNGDLPVKCPICATLKGRFTEIK